MPVRKLTTPRRSALPAAAALALTTALRHHRGMATSAPPPSLARRLHLQRYLVTGLLTLLPLWLTWVVFEFLFRLLSGMSAPWSGAIAARLAQAHPGALGWLDEPWVQSLFALLATLAVIYLVGLLATRVFGQRMLGAVDSLIARIPLAQTVYGGAKKLLDIMQTKPDGAQRVVLIDFPHAGMKTVGLVTRVFRNVADGREYAAVYVPTTPNPTSGYLEVVPVEDLTTTDWTMDQAMAFIISGGAIAPDPVSFGRRGDA
jgi:uncharacterized membrane protein